MRPNYVTDLLVKNCGSALLQKVAQFVQYVRSFLSLSLSISLFISLFIYFFLSLPLGALIGLSLSLSRSFKDIIKAKKIYCNEGNIKSYYDKVNDVILHVPIFFWEPFCLIFSRNKNSLKAMKQ